MAADAVQVDLVQDAGAVARPGGDLGGRAGGVQPERQGGMAQVVRAASQRGSGPDLPVVHRASWAQTGRWQRELRA